MAKVCISAASLTSLVFIPMDLVTFAGAPATLSYFLSVRVAIAIGFLLGLAALSRSRSARNGLAIAHLYLVFFFAANALVFDHPMLLRHGGAFFPLIAVALNTCLPGPFVRSLILTAYGSVISLLFWGVLRPEAEAAADLMIIALLTAVAFVVGGFMRQATNRLRREQFLHVRREQQINLDLAEAKRRAELTAMAKAEFLALMSHEIRTPMNAVMGMVGLMRRDAPSPDQARRLAIIHDAGRRLVQLLDDALDLAWIEARSVRLVVEPVDLAALVREVVGLMQPEAEAKGLRLHSRIEGLHAAYYADGLRVQQVLTNLIGNAIKYSSHGIIDMRLQAEPLEAGRDRLRLSVDDQGPGIPDSVKDEIFEPFRRYDRVGRQSGAGLGLAVVRRLAQAMGGSVGVSDRPGGGASFHVIFPAERTAPPVRTVEEPLPPLPPLTILVVEDAPENQAVLRELLEPMGHRLVTVDDGDAVCPMLAQHGFDLILMDIRLSRVDGVEAARRVRSLPDLQQSMIPIIAVTANVSRDDEAVYLAAGIDELVAKPVEPAQLMDAMRRHAPACAVPMDGVPPVPAGGHVPARTLFFQACRDQRAALERALSAGDDAHILAIAHRLKGSAGSFGFSALAAAAIPLAHEVPADPAERQRLGLVLLHEIDDALSRQDA
ncbi:ATP-binding protein [Oleisolibacter albus]|uniref:ATP-binding protein n=1 Tax=Oleisolibacter albus TaxID=2171757 RepID=UPI00138FD59E|nr:ATP-binding protein [Oleisolibacter albus]